MYLSNRRRFYRGTGPCSSLPEVFYSSYLDSGLPQMFMFIVRQFTVSNDDAYNISKTGAEILAT